MRRLSESARLAEHRSERMPGGQRPRCIKTSEQITVVGRVVRVRPHGEGWRVRLTDTGGTLAAADIRHSSRLALPRIGARIFIQGQLRYDEQHRWHVVDAVTGWREAPER